MKITLKLLFLALIVGSVSCSKEVTFDSPIQAELRGTWVPVLYTYEGHRTLTGNEIFDFETFTGFGWEMNFTMVFGENPNDYSLTGNYFLDHIVTNDEGQSYLITTFNVYDDIGTWTMNSNNITVLVEDEETVMTISELTQTSLVLRISQTFSEVGNDNVTTIETTLNEEYVLERL